MTIRLLALCLALAAAGLALGLACTVPPLDEAGKECTATCPGGLPCVNGRCGGSRCAQPDGAARPGPAMAWIGVGDGGFCIDSTEVTNAQFNDYVVTGVNGAPLGKHLPQACTVGVAPAPERVSDPRLADLPVSGQALTFCYAWSYCEWAGKRLCGGLGDGGVVSSAADPHDLEWYYACANGSRDTTYAYGDEVEDGACNVSSGAPADAGAHARCHGLDGSFAQVFDLTGNVGEYVNNVDGTGNLAAVGSTFDPAYNSGDLGTCAFAKGFNGTVQGIDAVGFRCCASP